MADTMLNGDEIAVFKKKYPKVFDNAWLDAEQSLIFEWLTPSNQIVVKYEEPEIRLIGMVSHIDYHMMDQKLLDVAAEVLGVKRPKYFKYDTIEEMIANIADLKGEEGVCVYYGDDQHIRKIKSDWYLSVHNFRNAMNLKNIVDLFFIMGQPDYNKFCEGVMNQFTWEGLQMALPLISKVTDAMREVHRILDGMRAFIQRSIKHYNPFDKTHRKDIAAKIYEAYGNTSRADIVFTLLGNKELNRNQWKKLYIRGSMTHPFKCNLILMMKFL